MILPQAYSQTARVEVADLATTGRTPEVAEIWTHKNKMQDTSRPTVNKLAYTGYYSRNRGQGLVREERLNSSSPAFFPLPARGQSCERPKLRKAHSLTYHKAEHGDVLWSLSRRHQVCTRINTDICVPLGSCSIVAPPIWPFRFSTPPGLLGLATMMRSAAAIEAIDACTANTVRQLYSVLFSKVI